MLQVIQQPNQPSGLAMLGQTLLGATADYAAEKRRREDEDRRRANQLQDVASSRQYEQSNFDKIRNLQLTDEQRKRAETWDDKTKWEAYQARQQMIDEAVKRGILQGTDRGNQQKEDDAIKQVAAMLAQESQFSQQQPKNAQSRLAELQQSEQQITSRMQGVEAKLNSRPTIDPAQVRALATQMATQVNGGKMPSNEQISAAVPDAQQKIEQQATVEWFQSKQEAQTQYQILSNQLTNIRQQEGDIIKTFRVAPTASILQPATGAAGAPPSSAPTGGNPLGGFLKSLPVAPPSTTDGTPPPVSFQDLATARRIAPPEVQGPLKQTGTEMLTSQLAGLDAPINDTQQKISDINDRLKLLQAGVTPFAEAAMANPFGVPSLGAVGAAPPVSDPGEMITRLLLQKQAYQRQLQDQITKRQNQKNQTLSNLQFNPSSPATVPPVTSPSVGALISDPYAAPGL